MDTLSRDVVGVILSLLGARDVVSFCCVCRRWNELAHSAVFTVPMLYVRPDKWRALMGDVQRWKMAFRGLCVSSAKQTWSVRCTADDFPACKTSVEGLFEVIRRFLGDSAACRRFERLKELHLGGLTKASAALTAAGPLFAHLEVLSLPRVQCDEFVMAAINKLTTLRHLNLQFATGAHPDDPITLPLLEEVVGLSDRALRGLPHPERVRIFVASQNAFIADEDVRHKLSGVELLYSRYVSGMRLSEFPLLKRAFGRKFDDIPQYMLEADFFSDVRRLVSWNEDMGFRHTWIDFEPLKPITLEKLHEFHVSFDNPLWLHYALNKCVQHLEVLILRGWQLFPGMEHSFSFVAAEFPRLTELTLVNVPSTFFVEAANASFPSLVKLSISDHMNLLSPVNFQRSKMPQLRVFVLDMSLFAITKGDFLEPVASLLAQNLNFEIRVRSATAMSIVHMMNTHGPFSRFHVIGTVTGPYPKPLMVHPQTADSAVFSWATRTNDPAEVLRWIRRT